MLSLVDSFTSGTGWTGSSSKMSVFGINEIREFIAGINDSSIIFKVDSGSNGEYITKTGYDINLNDYEEVVFHFWSRNQKWKGSRYDLSGNFAYALDFYKTNAKVARIFIPTFERMIDVTMKCAGLGSIDEIRIVCLHDEADYIIVSNMVAVKDELPRDIFEGIKNQLLYDIGKLYPRINGILDKGILIGTVNASVDDKSIQFQTASKFIEKYAVIKIDDGTNSEVHQILSSDGLEFFFNTNYAGLKVVNNFTNASVYLIVPVEFGLSEEEILLPGIGIWGMNPEEVYDISKLDTVRDTFKDDETVQTREADAKFRYKILIDCEARHNELIAFMSRAVKNFIARQKVWVNGKSIEFFSDGTSTYIEPVEGYNEIPKIQYVIRIEVKEEIFDRIEQVKTVSSSLMVDIQ